MIKDNHVRAIDLANLVRGTIDNNSLIVDRRVFTDQQVFGKEIEELFERGWIFLAHETQVPNAGDYVSVYAGQQPLIVCRGSDGKINAFVNSCRHRGAKVGHLSKGNARRFLCNYHGWVYDLAGRCIHIPDEDHGHYDDAFLKTDHNLLAMSHVESYRGFIFGSLHPTQLSLKDYLGDAAVFIDMINAQSPDGVEVVEGSSTYIYEGNWKLQLENCSDSYHLLSTHQSFMNIVAKRKMGDSKNAAGNQVDFADFTKNRPECGSFIFRNGHALVWQDVAGIDQRLQEGQRTTLTELYGPVWAKWLFYTRNLTIFPNLQLVDNAALQMRIIRPLSPNRTEMRIFCLAPVGEDLGTRERRIRRYEDFFNAAGLATPDDNRCYEDCQEGYQGRAIMLQQGYARGAQALIEGPDEHAKALGIRPAASISGQFLQDEMVFKSAYLSWLERVPRNRSELGD